MNQKLKIAIDGPAASGKSTTAQLLAKKLNYVYLDTGAMYRAITLAVINAGIDTDNVQEVIKIAQQAKIDLVQTSEGMVTRLNNEDVSAKIRSPEIDKVISKISAYARVREILVEKQRKIAGRGGVVMDGRDIGTVVLPDAEVKIFMQAGVEERARRRFVELKQKNMPVNMEEIKNEIIRRDQLDSSREVSPLMPAKDAYIIDTTGLTINQQVEKILEIIRTVS